MPGVLSKASGDAEEIENVAFPECEADIAGSSLGPGKECICGLAKGDKAVKCTKANFVTTKQEN
jgi:hypothetical protein